jgi:DNA-binding MarR family transcriptional regulator
MHNTYDYESLAQALIEVVGMLNSPRQDEILLRQAGVSLDRALFALLVRIGAADSLNVAALAEQVGRDQSTVSRQMAKLEAMGLVERRAAKSDQRSREAAITGDGRQLVRAITKARRRLLEQLLSGWSAADVQSLARLNRRLAAAMKATLGEILAHHRVP